MWTHRKLTSATRISASLTRRVAGMAEMKANSLPVRESITPMSQSLRQPGGHMAHRRKAGE